MQRDVGDLGPGPPAGLEHLRSEVQPGGRSGRGARLAGEDRLVALAVLRPVRPVDVGRQRHVAEPLELLVQIALAVEPHFPQAVLPAPDDLRLQFVVEIDDLADAHLAPRVNQRFPRQPVLGDRPQQQHLHPPGKVLPALRVVLADGEGVHPFPPPVEPRGDHLGIVQHQAIARAQVAGQVPEHPVFPPPLPPVEHQHPRGGAILERLLGDAVLGQVIIEVGELHPRASPVE